MIQLNTQVYKMFGGILDHLVDVRLSVGLSMGLSIHLSVQTDICPGFQTSLKIIMGDDDTMTHAQYH